jgi:hypothetical protein
MWMICDACGQTEGEPMTTSDVARKIKVASTISDPPVITPADAARIEQESRRLHDAFAARTACMEVLTVDDLQIRIR